jgi:hypothetical protein
MGRFETLNAETQDVVQCLLPALAASFGLSDPLDIIPEDIRMRAWDCDRRDHIKDQTENDPRNWGVQFLKDLMAISRLKNGDLDLFQEDLRAKVALHEPKHPWCRLQDIKELKDEYLHPNRPKAVAEESSGTSSTDSYLEELHEPDLPPGSKRARQRNHEIYETRVQHKHRKRKSEQILPKRYILIRPDKRPARLRRGEDGSYIRAEKGQAKSRYSSERTTSPDARRTFRRPSRIIPSDDDESNGSSHGMVYGSRSNPVFSMSPGPSHVPAFIRDEVDASNEPLEVQKMKAELEVAEAELKAARLRHEYVQAKERAEKEAKYGKPNANLTPHVFN